MKLNPYFGRFGGQFVPEILIPALDQLETAFIESRNDPAFQSELAELLTTYAGRPTPLTKCRNLTAGTKTTIYLKREDLVHGGAHKTNQVLGQALLAKRMGKTRIIAETLAYALKIARENPEKEQKLIVNLSGRGDKDIFTVSQILEEKGLFTEGRLDADAAHKLTDCEGGRHD